MNIFADERNLVHDQSQEQLVGFVNIRKELYGWKKDPDLAALCLQFCIKLMMSDHTPMLMY